MAGFSARSTADDVLRGHDLAGRTLVVTGASSGIGYETARALAAAGARVHCGARTLTKAQGVVEQVLAAHPHADVHPFVADLGSMASCSAATRAFPDPVVHGFVANAGVCLSRYQVTEDGLEATVGTCHFGHAALLHGLRDRLEAADGARVVMVASHSHYTARHFDPESPCPTEQSFGTLSAYDTAKLCNVLYASALDRKLAAHGVRATSLHPGSLVATALGRNSWLVNALQWLGRPFTKSLGQAAATSVYAVAHPAMADVGGVYLDHCQPRTPSKTALDQDVQDRLWAHTEDWLAEHFSPGPA